MYPRDVFKEAFHYEIMENGELWMEMLEQRNLISHSYDENNAATALQKIKVFYFPAITQLINFFGNEEFTVK